MVQYGLDAFSPIKFISVGRAEQKKSLTTTKPPRYSQVGIRITKLF